VADTGAGTTDLTISAPAGVVAATDVLLVAMTWTGGTGVTVTPPTTFTLVARVDSGTDLGMGIYVGTYVAGNRTWSFGASVNALSHALAFTGGDLQSPVSMADAMALASGTALTAPGLKPTEAVQLLATFHAVLASATLTAPTDMIERLNNSGSVSLASNTVVWASKESVPQMTETASVAGVGLTASVLLQGNLAVLEEVVDMVVEDAQDVLVYAV
jgi:hypothetical protein